MRKTLIMMFLITMLIFTTSCQEKKKQDIKVELKKENAVPKELLKITETIDNIEKELSNLKVENEKTDQVEVKKEKEKMIENLKESEENKDKKDSEQDDELKVVETHKEKIYGIWNNLDKQIKSGHSALNDYKMKAVEDNANEKNIENLEENLNNLTIFIENKDLLNSFISNNQIYNDISYFLSLYEDYECQILKLKHYVNNIYINGLKDEWYKALEGMNLVSDQYNETQKEYNKTLKDKEKLTKEEKAKEKNLEKLKLSIDSLKQSINKEDIKLLEIKREVVISNLESVKK